MKRIKMKRTKKGFTLIELLAVILILSVIALIAVPTITSIIEDSKKAALKSSAEVLADAAEKQCQVEQMKGSTITNSYTIVDGEISKELDIKNYPQAGEITIDDECNAEIAINDGNYCVFASADISTITSDVANCTLENMPLPDTSESCFIFNESTRTITGYNYANRSCPSEISIPATINNIPVEYIADMAFINGDYNLILATGIKETEDGIDELSGISMTLENSLALGQTIIELYPVNVLNSSITQSCYTDLTSSSFDSKPLDYVITEGDGYLACMPNIRDYIEGVDYKLVASSGVRRLDLSKATNLVSIGKGSFMYNTIESVKFENLPNLTNIGVGAFGGNGIKGKLDLSGLTGVTNIENSVFTDNQISEVVLPSNIKEIGYMAFAENSLTSLELPSGLERIGTSAFEYNILEKTNIPASVTYIGDYAFAENSFTSLTFEAGTPTLGTYIFANNTGRIDTLIIPDTWTNIPKKMFYETGINNLILGKNIEKINSQAFAASYISNITWGEKLLVIEFSAFFHLRVENLVIPNTVTHIFHGAFAQTTSKNIVIPDSVIFIEYSSFNGQNADTITIGSGIEKIGASAFGCHKSTCHAVIEINRAEGKVSGSPWNAFGTSVIKWVGES